MDSEDPENDPDHTHVLGPWTCPENFIEIRPKHFELSSFKEFRDPEDPDSDPDHSQNLITSSFTNFSHILKISLKSLHTFLSYLSLKIKFHGSIRSRQ